jgi:hypothetical protein
MSKQKTLTLVLLALGVVYAAEAQDSWTDKTSISGDVRLRHETIDDDRASDTRNRWRIRARLGLKSDVTDSVEAGFRFVSGSDDPVSSNQTLDGGFSSKDLNLDQAYLKWKPETMDGLALVGGKFKNPFIRTQDLLWDGDLSPEGVAFNHTIEGEVLNLMANGAVFFAEERSSDDDSWMYGLQLAGELKPDDDTTILAGAGFYYWDNLEGFPTLYDEEDSFGNFTTGGDTDPETGETSPLLYADEFAEVEFFTQVKMDLGLPVALFGDVVLNTEADDEDLGWLVGAELGKAKDPGTYSLGYDYRNLEANAVVGAFTDSDSGGGGTDVSGHRVKGKYQIAKNYQTALTLFFNETGISGEEEDYFRLQLDLIGKF